MNILYFFILFSWLLHAAQINRVFDNNNPYKILYSQIISCPSNQCSCSNQLVGCFFWLEKAFETNSESLLFLLLNHPYQRKLLTNLSSSTICTGFNPFRSNFNAGTLGLNALEVELLKSHHSDLARRMLKLWTSDTQNNPFLDEWNSLFNRWKFQLYLLKYLEKIPYNDTISPFLKDQVQQEYQWRFLLQCYHAFIDSKNSYIANKISIHRQLYKSLWHFDEYIIQRLAGMEISAINALSNTLVKSIKARFKNIFNYSIMSQQPTKEDFYVFRGQSDSLFCSDKLINAWIKLHS